jgi:alkyl hydroperoxide reductase subunit AhpC
MSQYWNELSGGLDGALAPLPVGTRARAFALPAAAQTAQSVLTLQSLRGKAVVLVFYPLDWEPVSREQLMLYQSYADEFAHFGAHLLGISVDHAASHAAFARDAQIRFPLLADFQPRGAIARRYGVYRPAQGVSGRALFVVEPLGVIRFSEVYPDALNPGVDNILTTLEAMATSQRA